MRTIIIYSTLLTFFCGGCFALRDKKIKDTKSNESAIKKDFIFNIQKIDSLNNFYILYASKNNKLYKIIEEKKYSATCNVIKVGSNQYLNLRSILNQPIMIDSVTFSSSNSLNVNCFTFDKETIICKEEGIYDLYQALNMEGLCIKENGN